MAVCAPTPKKSHSDWAGSKYWASNFLFSMSRLLSILSGQLLQYQVTFDSQTFDSLFNAKHTFVSEKYSPYFRTSLSTSISAWEVHHYNLNPLNFLSLISCPTTKVVSYLEQMRFMFSWLRLNPIFSFVLFHSNAK